LRKTSIFISLFISLSLLLVLFSCGIVFAQESSYYGGINPSDGCMTCHSDTDLEANGKSLYIDEEAYKKSVHGNVLCSECHLGFTISLPHPEVKGDPLRVASLACKDCHKDVYSEYKNSVHGKAALMGKADSASCGDCHGEHYIKSLKDEEVKDEFWANAEEVCGECHRDYWENYGDYYHGQAYKVGFKKAPTCWQCHDYHNILSKDNPNSRISDENLYKTCEDCHPGSTKGFADGYGPSIHGLQEGFETNIVLKWFRGLFSWFPW